MRLLRIWSILIVSLGHQGAMLTAASDNSPIVGSLQWYAERAKAEGRSSIVVPASSGIPVMLKSLDDALKTYSVLLAVPEAMKMDQLDDFHIGTWYKLKVVDRIRVYNAEIDSLGPKIPDQFQTLKSDELLVYIHGGEITLDDVKLSTPYSPIPALQLGKKYVFFTLLDEGRNVGYLHAGKNAVFKVTDTDTFEPLSSTSTSFHEDVRQKTANSITLLKEEIKQLTPPQ